MPQRAPEATPRVYVSITGLRVHGILHLPLFWLHAIPAFKQARRAPGCLSVAVRKVDGVMHTLTVWESEDAMRGFLYEGAHLAAIRAFRRIGTGTTCGYWTDRVPDWSEALAIWKAEGRGYGPTGAAIPAPAPGQ